MVVAYQIHRGARFRLVAVGIEEHGKIHLPYLDFQRQALQKAPAEWPKLVRILDYFAEAGPFRDSDKSKFLRDGILEFRTKGGLRLLWFYDEGRVVICANGYFKQGQKIPNTEIDAAIRWKNDYFAARKAGKLRDITMA